MAKKAEIIVGQVYQHRKNPKRVGKVVRVSNYPDLITLELANGDLPTTTREGLSKSWKRLEGGAETVTEETAEAVVEATAEPTADTKDEQFKTAELDVSKYEKKEKNSRKKDASKKADEKQEKSAKPEKKKREHKPKNSPEVIDALIAHIIEYTENLGGDCGVPRDADMKFRALRKNGRQFCKLLWSGKSVKLASNSETSCTFRKINYSLSCLYEFVNNDADTLASIDELLKLSYDECPEKIIRKKKEEK